MPKLPNWRMCTNQTYKRRNDSSTARNTPTVRLNTEYNFSKSVNFFVLHVDLAPYYFRNSTAILNLNPVWFRVRFQGFHYMHTTRFSIHQGTLPAKIPEEEQRLPRIASIRLPQLRTGYGPVLNSYLIGICSNVYNGCPNCEVARMTKHIFNCSKNTSDLKVTHLCERCG